MQRYALRGAQLLCSDEDGEILVEMDAQSLQVERYRLSHRYYWTHSQQSYWDGKRDTLSN